MSAEAAGHIVGYAAPVAGILHVDILRHLEVNAGGVHILIIGIVTEVDKVVRSLDKIRILLRSLSAQGMRSRTSIVTEVRRMPYVMQTVSVVSSSFAGAESL